MRIRLAFAKTLLVGFVCQIATTVSAAEPAALRIELTGSAAVVFEVARKPCPVFTQPDINPRAFRDAVGRTHVFALDQDNRPLTGRSILSLEPSCRSALSSAENADPAAFDGRRYITATWTIDGKNVAALVHNEYHADAHPGRCRTTNALACWSNTILAAQSSDGGANFLPASPLVVASAPFRQDVDQTRHRGFFNPSNMFAGPGGVYVFTSTTGWSGQEAGACLLRNADPFNPAGWRGWNGRAFAARWSDPYRQTPRADACQPLKPFGYPVASVVRHRATGLFVAIWEQPKLSDPTPFGDFPIAGIYLATSRNLIDWSEPSVVVPTAVVHQPCGLHNENRGGTILAYPALLDDHADGRNYDDVGDDAWLFVTRIALDGCNPGARRVLVRQAVRIVPDEARKRPLR